MISLSYGLPSHIRSIIICLLKIISRTTFYFFHPLLSFSTISLQSLPTFSLHFLSLFSFLFPFYHSTFSHSFLTPLFLSTSLQFLFLLLSTFILYFLSPLSYCTPSLYIFSLNLYFLIYIYYILQFSTFSLCFATLFFVHFLALLSRSF